MTDKCKRCKKGTIVYKDFGFMIRSLCNVCGDTHDEPKKGREQEFHQWSYDSINRLVDELEK